MLLAAAAVRLPGLGFCPPPLTPDEASRIYDAWSLWETGRDRHGAALPLFQESFGAGDYTAALSTWLTIPFVAALGPTPQAGRLPDALLSLATVVLLYGWLRRAWGAAVALMGAAVLAVDPWHVTLTRTAHESGFAPFFLTAGCYALTRAGLWPPAFAASVETASISALPKTATAETAPASAWALLAGAAFGLCAWVYPATRLFVPLWLAALAGVGGRAYLQMLHCREGRFRLAVGLAGLAAGAFPVWWTAFDAPHQIAARASATLIFQEEGWIGRLVRNHLAFYDPRYWFLSFDEMAGPHMRRIGLHLPVFAPFFIIGLIIILRRARSGPLERFLLLWLLLAPLPGSICRDAAPNSLRCVGGMTLFPLFAGVGLSAAWDWLARHRPASNRSAILLLAGLACADAGRVVHEYLRVVCPDARNSYQTLLIDAVRFAAESPDRGEFVLVTNKANQPYIYALLFAPIPPRQLLSDPLVDAEGPRGFHQVLRTGRFHFAYLDYSRFPAAAELFNREWDRVPQGTEGLVILAVGETGPGEVVRQFAAESTTGQTYGYEIRRWRKDE